MKKYKAQKTDSSEVLASITNKGIKTKHQKQELSFEERLKTLARLTKYLLENDPSYLRSYKNRPWLLKQTKKWITEQLQ